MDVKLEALNPADRIPLIRKTWELELNLGSHGPWTQLLDLAHFRAGSRFGGQVTDTAYDEVANELREKLSFVVRQQRQ